MAKSLKVITFAGGGTAGHVEPAIAVAKWLNIHAPEILCEFVGSKTGIENKLVTSAGYTLHNITKAPFPRSASATSILWPFRFTRSILQTRNAMNESDLLIGFGGYISASCYFLAQLKRIPYIVHEANARPGWANAFGAKRADALLIAFDSTRQFSPKWKSAKVVGIPVKQSITDLSNTLPARAIEMREERCKEWNFDPKRPIVLVFGGSLGSRKFNEVIAEARPLMSLAGIQVVHAVGAKNQLPEPSLNYYPVKYIEDMATAYVAADLIISRSGAVTCAELELVRRYALLIPLPIGNGEQDLNARVLVNAGQATLLKDSEFTADWLSSHVISLLSQSKSWVMSATKTNFPRNSDELIGRIILQQFTIQDAKRSR